MADSDQLSALTKFLRRSVRTNQALTVDGIEYVGVAGMHQLSLLAFSRMSDGTTVIRVAFEGGETQAVTNCPPHILMEACESVISDEDPSNPLANTDFSQRYADFSGGRIEP